MRDIRAFAEAISNQVEEVDAIDESTCQAARRVICGNAVGETLQEQVADATELMMALGVHPSQSNEGGYLSSVVGLPTDPPGMRLT